MRCPINYNVIRMFTEGDRQRVLDAGIVIGSFRLVSGVETNQKFDFDLIHGEVFDICVSGLVRVILAEFADVSGIVTVAEGATRLGGPIEEQLGIKHFMTTHNNKKPRVFRLLGKVSGNVVIVDDVFTRGTTIREIANIIDQQPDANIIGAAVILNRSSDPSPTLDTPTGAIPVRSVIHYDMG